MSDRLKKGYKEISWKGFRGARCRTIDVNAWKLSHSFLETVFVN
jgi:hypothetical protein